MELLEQEEPPLPKIIGLTGGIGSGKSTVAKIFEEKGVPVYYSDDRAKSIVYHDSVKAEILDLIGPQAYTETGEYNRPYISSLVFQDKELLEKLNHIIHPAVKKDFENWMSVQKAPFILKETALLFELNLHLQCYKSILVTAEDNLRIKRVMDRDHKTYREVESVIHNQMPEKDKCKKAHYIIFNNTTFEDLQLQTLETLSKILADIA